MTDILTHRFAAGDGLELTYRELGAGRPLILIHGFAGTGRLWLDFGGATTIARHGHRVILPDLRGHSDGARPRDPARYPPDVLADDTLALISHLGLPEGGYDLGGYSLGGRIVIRALVRGARPARAIVAGQGLSDMTRAAGSGTYYRALTAMAYGHRLRPGSSEAQLAYWFSQGDIDPQALLHVLDSLVATPAAAVRAIPTPTLVAVGDQDAGRTGEALAEALPRGRFRSVAGDHWSAAAGPEMPEAILGFLGGIR